jgi:hypothetical protein
MEHHHRCVWCLHALLSLQHRMPMVVLLMGGVLFALAIDLYGTLED